MSALAAGLLSRRWHSWFVFLSATVAFLAGNVSAPGQSAVYSWANFVGQPGGYGNADGLSAGARFYNPSGVAVDGAGNVFVADSNNHTIRKITPGGVVTTLAGSAGNAGSDDGTGGAARFNYPAGVAVDNGGNVIVADGNNHTIRRVTQGGVVTTLAGSAGTSGSTDGTGTAALFNLPQSVTVDGSGNIFVADYNNHTIRKITPGSMVTTLAGSAGSFGSTDGTGTAARFRNPAGVSVDGAGNVFVADSRNHTIRKVTSGGDVTTLAGSAGTSGSANGTGAVARFNLPQGVAVDGLGNVFVADSNNHTIRKVTSLGAVTTPAGSAGNAGSADGTGSAARFNYPSSVVVNGAGNVIVADNSNHTIRQMTALGVVTTLAGSASGTGSADGTGTAARFDLPQGVAVDSANNVYVADYVNHTVRKATAAGVVTTLAGSAGSAGSDDGTGGAARFNLPQGVAVDSAGNVYVADSNNHTIRKVTSGGDVTTLAGDAGNAGTADGVGAAAQFNFPSGVAVDGASNVYVADSYNHAIRKITPGGVVTTLAGDAGNAGNADGTGSAAKFDLPQGVAVDGAGNVYVADSNNHTIRKVTATGVVTTLAGSAGNTGSADGTGSAARFNFPSGVAVDGAGNVFTADSGNHTIRRVSTGGVVTTVGGAAGVVGGGDGAGGGARFAIPAGIAMGGNASLYVADSDNNRVSKGTPVDALYAVVYKAQSLGQTNTGAAVLLPLAMEPTPFSFGAYLKQTPNGTVNGVTLELTDSSVQILGPGSPPSNQLDFEYKQSFATKTLMDTAFGNGTYTFSINAAHDGLKSLPVAMAGDSYPSAAPHISNWTDTQALYPATNFTVTWDALPGGATNDFVLFQVREMVSGNPSNYVFQTEVPGAVSALNGTNTSAVIPSGTLAQGRTYLATLLWCKPASTDAATYPGAVGFGMYGIQTMFLLTTTTPAQMITPTNGVTLTRGSTTFTWDSGVGVTQYALWVGSTPASYDLYAAVEPAQSRTLSLPTDGRTLYVRLWSFIAGGWQFNDYVYTAYRTLEISSGSVLPAGIFNIGYNQALQAVGGTGAYTWSWSGSMPPGLGLSAGGLLSGTPTAMGFYNFTIQVDDAFGATTNQNVSMMVRGQDVSYAMAMKEQLFRQTNTGAAVVPPPGLDPTPFVFTTMVKQAPTGTVTTATARWPDTTVRALSAVTPPSPYSDWNWQTNFPTKTAMDAAVTNGNYTFTIEATHDGTNVLFVNLPPDNYPTNAPHISNWAAAQAVNAAAAFTLTWDSLTGGTSNDFVWVQVTDSSNSNTLFATPAWGRAGALNGTNTSVVIPGGTFTTNQACQAEIGWCRFGALDTTNYPGAAGAGAHAKATVFPMHTTAPGHMLSPTNGTVFAQDNITFNWAAGTGATQYALWVGSTAASYDLYALAVGTNLTRTLALSATGRPVYLRLWSLIGSDWNYIDYTYTGATPVMAQMLSPADGSTNSSASMAFAWNSGVGVSQYALWVGSTPNSYDLFAAALGTNRSQTVTAPITGAPLYARLWSLISGAWQYNDYVYTAAIPAKAVMLSPADGSTNNSASVTYTWSAGAGVSQYALWVGSATNSSDLYALALGTNLSRTLTLPVDGRTLYTRLWSCTNSVWDYNDYTYRAQPTAKARFTGLANGATFGATNITLTWDAGVGATQYALWVGNSAGTYDLYALALGTNRSQLLNLPADGRALYVTLWSLINGEWKRNDYKFTAFTTASAAQMITPTNGTTFASSPVTFTWSSGTGVSQYAMWMGSAWGDYDLYAAALGTNLTQQVPVPLDGNGVYVRLWSLIGGVWDRVDYEYGTAYSSGKTKAVMTTPGANGSVLGGASAGFAWSAGVGATQYALWAGTTPGSYNLYAAAEGTNLTRTVTIPPDGGPVYVRLWSQIDGAWKFNDYFYSAYLAP